MKESKYLRKLHTEDWECDYHTFYVKSEEEFYSRFKCCEGCLVLATCMGFDERKKFTPVAGTPFDIKEYPYLITIKKPCKKFENTYGMATDEKDKDR